MKRRFQAVFVTNFKILFGLIAVFLLCGFSSAGKPEVIKVKVIAKIEIPKWYHEGLYFDGKDIWVNNGKNGKTWVIDTSNGSVIKEIDPAGTFTEAMTAKDMDTLFVTDWDFKKIYTTRITDAEMSAESEVSVAPAHPTGIAWNGENLFVITWTRGLGGTKFNMLKMDDKFNIISSTPIKNIAEPAHLAWDGKNLWVSCWYSRRVYKLDADDFKILGYFRSPVKKTTGIAWDGKYLWLTGTYSNLYKMEIQH